MQLQPAIKLPAPKQVNKIVISDGYNADIIATLNKQFNTAVKQTKEAYFSGTTLTEKGRAIYNYLRNSVMYKKDPEGKQLIQLPARMLGDGGTKSGDCKSLALAAAAFMHNNGFNNVRLRYTSYSATDTTPTHVYAVGSDETGKDIIIDAVYRQFNKEVPYKFKKDYQMQISVLSGVSQAPMRQEQRKLKLNPMRQEQRKLNIQVMPKDKYAARLRMLLTKVRAGGLMFNVITNELARTTGTGFSTVKYGADQIAQYRNNLVKRAASLKKPYLQQLIAKEVAIIDGGTFKGNLYTPRTGEAIKGLEEEIGKLSLKRLGKGIKKAVKKVSPKSLLKGVKAVGFVAPRKAFLLLVRLNVRGLATRLSKLSDADLKKLWEQRFAGKLSVLKSTISKGKKKKPLFGASKKVRAIKGIGVVVDNSTDFSIGATGAEIATVVAAAAPILVAFAAALKGKGVPEVPENAGAPEDSGDFSEAEGEAAEDRPKAAEWIQKATEIARATGIIPDKPETMAESRVSQVVQGDDLEAEPAAIAAGDTGTGMKLSPVVLIGAAAAVGFLLMNRKKK